MNEVQFYIKYGHEFCDFQCEYIILAVIDGVEIL